MKNHVKFEHTRYRVYSVARILNFPMFVNVNFHSIRTLLLKLVKCRSGNMFSINSIFTGYSGAESRAQNPHQYDSYYMENFLSQIIYFIRKFFIEIVIVDRRSLIGFEMKSKDPRQNKIWPQNAPSHGNSSEFGAEEVS